MLYLLLIFLPTSTHEMHGKEDAHLPSLAHRRHHIIYTEGDLREVGFVQILNVRNTLC